MKTTKLLLLAGLLVFAVYTSSSQTVNDTVNVQVETHDGNNFVGKVISEDSEKLLLDTENLGEITIQKKDIKTRAVVPDSQVIGGEWWFYNPQSSRYFWAPNGYGLRKGEGYYHNIWVLWNQFAYGLSDHISIGGAVIPLFLFGGTATPVFINPKVSIPVVKDKFNIGAGALFGTLLGESEGGFGILYGVTTFGSHNRNLSFGLGYGFADGDWTSVPLINISGMTRLSPRWYLMSENYLVFTDGEGGALLNTGARWMIRKAALDFGLVVPVGSGIETFIGIPWLGFTVPFGKPN